MLKNLNLNNIDLNNVDLSQLKVNTKGYENVELSPEHEEMIKNTGQLIEDVRKSKILTCDKECRENQKKDLLYNDYLQARQNAENAPRILEEAERNFYEFSKGTAQYNKFKEGEYSKEATSVINKIAKQYLERLERVLELYNTYNTQKSYMQNVNEIIATYEKENQHLEKKIKHDMNVDHLNNRKSYYAIQKNDFYEWISSMLTTIYYILAASYMVVFVFINKQYTNVRLWLRCIGLLSVPLVSTYVYSKLNIYV